ncbi:Cys-tRNA(Pro) deacylase [Ileibacterium valens]|uniref:Cys-tRNA(Pro)/Cys-tRNA(Cys) deacylase n=1 Tax=Ileibacterium valens TaxID=1862668 RepID=A0A1U7NGW4_9FIRM|nr:Cys-tRNA(Pro) deacylase [Ileibacterium valens]OLU38184.1 hypothetical protein BO224_09575 [Erysipelotrichaceae bacterium NYU-BL-E8]OLU40647.1 hypothetical protein BO222_04665 [Ileibacterium valens]OLU43313.1 hypothetical protein BM735_00565 [Erysipelotrichaceae bacterium NYU-BL-F16]
MSKKSKHDKGSTKTNAMRILEDLNIEYIPHELNTKITNGSELARTFGIDPAKTFKTLVTIANTKEYLVFLVPVDEKLSLKKAASAAGVKNVEMILQKDLFNRTGYVHGGCSPIGMKKSFRTFIDQSAENFDTILFSAGKIGEQIETDPKNLEKLSITFSDLTA